MAHPGAISGNRIWKILVLTAIVLFLLAALPVLPFMSRPVAAWFHSYHVWQFRGQGSIMYLGPFRPSSRVTWARVPLDRGVVCGLRALLGESPRTIRNGHSKAVPRGKVFLTRTAFTLECAEMRPIFCEYASGTLIPARRTLP